MKKIANLLIMCGLVTAVFYVANSPKTYAQTVEQQKAACEASKGTWTTTEVDLAGQVTSCTNCPAGTASDFNVCRPTTTSGDGTGSSFTVPTLVVDSTQGKSVCGKGKNQVSISFDIGCRGEDYPAQTLNPIVDMAFALFRFLSAGVGLVVIGSIIVAGIQYSTSRGNPQATQASINRITNALIALLLYVFMFAIVNYLVPGGLFK